MTSRLSNANYTNAVVALATRVKSVALASESARHQPTGIVCNLAMEIDTAGADDRAPPMAAVPGLQSDPFAMSVQKAQDVHTDNDHDWHTRGPKNQIAHSFLLKVSSRLTILVRDWRSPPTPYPRRDGARRPLPPTTPPPHRGAGLPQL